jgi:hypothetical protein
MKKKNTHKDLGFKIPDGYFETAMDRMFDKQAQPAVKQELPFTVPDTYFDNLEHRILSNTVHKETKSTSIDKNNPFEVPEDYFKNLGQQVFESTVDKPLVKMERDYPEWVIPMLAIAAIFIAIVTISGLWESNTFSIEDLNDDELGMYLAETDFRSDQEAIDILYSDADDFQNVTFDSSMDNEVLLEYLVDEVDMNIMMEE